MKEAQQTEAGMSKLHRTRKDATGAPLSVAAGTTPAAGERVRKHFWREAVSQVAMPALRLHRYRNARTRMLHEALCDLDCQR
jgi:hypothetical protein